MRARDYEQGHLPKRSIPHYNNSNPLLRTMGRRRPPEVTFLCEKDVVLLNITECNPQLYDTYLEQWIISVKRDYQARHELDVETWEAMIRIRENYLRGVARAPWKAFKDKFLGEIAKIAGQGNNILKFCYAMHRILMARDANT